jgi:8-oxo-dGTP pyrophosphatase MutT (NUDIX family)
MRRVDGISYVLMRPDGRILLQRRDKFTTYAPGKWCIPGGHRDEGESTIETAVREIKEETSLEVTQDQCEVMFEFPYLRDDEPKIDEFFLCMVDEERASRNIKCMEGAEMKWWKIETAQYHLSLASQQNRTIPHIMKYVQNRRQA